MQHIACPNCGAEVQFRSVASVMAVCEYCQSTLVKDAGTLQQIGRMAEVLEDYSPLQIHTSGLYQGQAFTVIGRIQLRYDAGFWNEWFILFASGDTAWLSDASGQYTLTRTLDAPPTLPAFEALKPGQALYLIDGEYTVADQRSAQCTGGQGELPFTVGPGWQAKVVDLRCGNRFMTLDYSDTPTQLYQGHAVLLDQLQCQLLRDEVTIQRTAGRFKGKIDTLDCPSCGQNVRFSPGITNHVICPACNTALDTAGKTAEIIQQANAATMTLSEIKTPLTLGDKATIDQIAYQLLGLMRRQTLGEVTIWTEYLLYSAQKGFLWLVQTDTAWYRTQVLDTWPSWHEGAVAKLDEVAYHREEEYQATVRFAVGAFNWRVSTGETTSVIEFVKGDTSLAAEMNAAELTWSRSQKIPAATVMGWFGKSTSQGMTSAAQTGSLSPASCKQWAKWAFIFYLVVNAIPLLLAPLRNLTGLLIVAAAIYLPAIVLDLFQTGENATPDDE